MLMLKILQNTVFKQLPQSSNSLSDSQKFSIDAGTELKIKSYFKKDSHYFVKLAKDLGTVGKSGFFFEGHIQIEEIRGIWITDIDSEILESKENIKKHLELLKKLKFNTLYPVVWKEGFAFFKSQVVDSIQNADETKLTSVELGKELAGRDILAEMIEINQDLGNHFRIIPWFEYGLMVHPQASLAVNNPEWLMLTFKGRNIVEEDGKCRLNPAHPDVQSLIVNLIKEVVQNYDIDGIQFDDHFAIYHTKFLRDNNKHFNFSMGFDDFTLNLFKTETGSAIPPSNPDSTAFKNWRKEKLTQLLRLIFQAIKSEKDDCILSVSPNPLGFSIAHSLADWKVWEQEGLIEELALQVYRFRGTFTENMTQFKNEIDKSEVQTAREHIPTLIGIMTGLKPTDHRVNLTLIQDQTKATRDRDFAGFAYFFYGSLFEHIPSTETVTQRETTFATILA